MDEKIETAAEALFFNRFGKSNGSWETYKYRRPDIAEIFRDNARVALTSVGVIPKQ